MKKFLIRLVERINIEDGLQAVEFLVSAQDRDDAVFRAGLLMHGHHPTVRATWVEWVKEIKE